MTIDDSIKSDLAKIREVLEMIELLWNCTQNDRAIVWVSDLDKPIEDLKLHLSILNFNDVQP